ncbi:MAG: enoyl-CoA hydratase/isomerase family protein [Burkholderiaceae bacterium]|nr:enoyl-CoA hydratase/isomerase family protein [Burkholderiaceae bacterium]
MNTIRVEHSGHIKRVTLNRPEKRNAISYELASELLAVTKEAESDGTRLLIIRGEGQGFCAGSPWAAPSPSQGFEDRLIRRNID